MGRSKGKIEKPSFLRSYLKSAVVVLIVMAIFGGLVLNMYIERYESIYRNQLWENYISLNYQLEDLYDLNPQNLAKIKKTLVDQYSDSGKITKVRIYNYQTDYMADGNPSDLVIDSSRTAIMKYTLGDGTSAPLEIADKKYLKYFERPDIEALSFYSSSLSPAHAQNPRTAFVCTEFYTDVKNNKFIPVEAEILEGEFPYAGEAKLSGVKVSIKPDPKDIEGFVLKKHSLANMTGEDSVKSVYEIPTYSEIAGSVSTDQINFEESGSSVVMNKDHTIEIFETGVEHIDFFTAYKKYILLLGGVIIGIALVFSFIPASIVYNTNMRKYQIFEYRRKMIDAMAHDLKTPMAAITAYAENITNHIGADKQEHYAEKIGEKVADMNRLVNNILDFSRSEATDLKLKSEEVDVGKMIGEILADNEAGISERSLNVNFAPGAVSVTTDPELFRQALANLISNAVLHSKAGTVVDISCSDKSVVMVNTAAGKIEDPGSLKQAFVKGSSSRGSRGSGLGLAIADNDLAMLGFKLEIRTEEDKFIATVKM